MVVYQLHEYILEHCVATLQFLVIILQLNFDLLQLHVIILKLHVLFQRLHACMNAIPCVHITFKPFLFHFYKDEAPATDADETIIRDDNHGTDLMYLEQKSILLALRSAVAPSLSGADAVMFATLLGDFFPSHDVPMMFNRGVQDSNELPVAEETIGLSLDREKGAPLQSLPGSPQPKDQGKLCLLSLYTLPSLCRAKTESLNFTGLGLREVSVESTGKLSQ